MVRRSNKPPARKASSSSGYIPGSLRNYLEDVDDNSSTQSEQSSPNQVVQLNAVSEPHDDDTPAPRVHYTVGQHHLGIAQRNAVSKPRYDDTPAPQVHYTVGQRHLGLNVVTNPIVGAEADAVTTAVANAAVQLDQENRMVAAMTSVREREALAMAELVTQTADRLSPRDLASFRIRLMDILRTYL